MRAGDANLGDEIRCDTKREVPPPAKDFFMNQRSEKVLLQDAAMHAAAERESQSKLLVDIAEIDARKVYREAGYDSIHGYCVQELGLSEKAAFHRIWVARVAWKFPCVLAALAEGRIHMSAVALLATYLSEANAEELVAASANRSKAEVAQLVAERFPRQDLFVSSAATSVTDLPGAREIASEVMEEPQAPTPDQHPPEGVESRIFSKAERVDERFPLKVGLRRETHEKLRRAQDLLAHVVPSGDVGEVLDRALDVLIHRLEKRKFALTNRPRRNCDASSGPSIPAEVRRVVVERDRGQCTFVAESGKRCLSRRRLEFDHVQPVSRGGRSTVANVRLLCRAHNQLMAERALGREFINGKIEQARELRARKAEEARALGTQLVSGLRRLGFSADESKRAVADFDGSHNATAEVRMKAALAYLVPGQRGQASP
jgi:HNH endonuclease